MGKGKKKSVMKNNGTDEAQAAIVALLAQMLMQKMNAQKPHKDPNVPQTPIVLTKEQKEKNAYNGWLSQMQAKRMREKMYAADKTVLETRNETTMSDGTVSSKEETLATLKKTYNMVTSNLQTRIIDVESKLSSGTTTSSCSARTFAK